MARFLLTVDVEKDLHTGKYLGVDQGLLKLEKLAKKHSFKPVLFVTADCIKHNPSLFKRLHKSGWEISLHGFSHRRFDDMSFPEKELEIKKSLAYWKKYLGFKPKGFRAPQHSIDADTLYLLEKYKFEYDSSYTPLNLTQFIFFPSKFALSFKSFFSPINPYKISPNLLEVPSSAFFLPFVSLTLRILPKPLLSIYHRLICSLYKKPVFYAHSWDFIPMSDSSIDNKFPHTKFISNLDYLMEISR